MAKAKWIIVVLIPVMAALLSVTTFLSEQDEVDSKLEFTCLEFQSASAKKAFEQNGTISKETLISNKRGESCKGSLLTVKSDQELLDDAAANVEAMKPYYQQVTSDIECLFIAVPSKKNGRYYVQFKPVVGKAGKLDCRVPNKLG